MKPAGWAILILSVLLAAALGVIAWGVHLAGQKDALLLAANKKATDAEDLAVKQAADIVRLEKSQTEKDGIIKGQKATIAKMEKAQVDAKNISAVVVAEGTGIKEAFMAGEPIVEATKIPALSLWFGDVLPLFDPHINHAIELQLKVDEWGALNVELSNANTRLYNLSIEDAVTIGDLKLQNSGILSNLSGVRLDLQSAINLGNIKDLVIGCETAIIVGFLLYESARVLGWIR